MIKLSEMFSQMQVYSNPQATPFKPKVEEDFDAVPAKWSSTEAKQMMDNDVKKMSKIL